MKSKHHGSPAKLLDGWEELTTLIADLCKVKACLVMRGNETSMEVMARSLTEGNPYKPREKAPRHNELYCETVIATRQPLGVPDSREDPDWKGNPDEALGMYSYYGVPVDWPDGSNFGTLCILDDKQKDINDTEQKLLKKFAEMLEMRLEIFFEISGTKSLDSVASS